MTRSQPPRTAATLLARVALVVALAVSAAGCWSNGNDDEDETTATTRRTTTTTAESTTTTTVEPKGPPEWIEVVRDLNQRYNDLLQNPDPAQLATLYAESCECWQDRYDTLKFLQTEGQHIEGEPAVLLWVRHEQTTPETGIVHLTTKDQVQPLNRVDANGVVIETLGNDEGPSCTSLSIHLDEPDNKYRIYTELPLNQCPAES